MTLQKSERARLSRTLVGIPGRSGARLPHRLGQFPTAVDYPLPLWPGRARSGIPQAAESVFEKGRASPSRRAVFSNCERSHASVAWRGCRALPIGIIQTGSEPSLEEGDVCPL